ncbi:MAG TPA: membrane protein insertase YidC, partial [Planctomycetota bacterium]|nr:membrane protein insertase YidC [Planctomycetota bacterium]
MDSKRLSLTLLMVVVTMVVWTYLFPPKPPKPKEPTPAPVSEGTGESTVSPVGEGPPTKTPAVVPLVTPDQVREVVLENDVLRLTFSNVGGVLVEADLLDVRPTALVPTGTPLKLISPSDQGLNSLRWEDTEHPEEAWGQALWNMERAADGRTVTFVREVDRGVPPNTIRIRKTKRISLKTGDARYADVELLAEVLAENRKESGHFSLLLSGGVFQEVGGQSMTPPRSALYPFEEEVVVIAANAKASAEAYPEETLRTGRGKGERRLLDDGARFVADLSNYHGIFFLLRDFPSGLNASIHPLVPAKHWPEGRRDFGEAGHRSCSIIQFRKSLESGKPSLFTGVLYFGPVDAARIGQYLKGAASEDELKALGQVYNDQLGWARPVAHSVLWLLRKIHGLVGNWGWSIIILTIIVRALLFPINRKSQRAMLLQQESMNRLKPDLDKLKKKFEKDPKKLMEEQMKLYRHHKVSMVPLGGCLPIFLQIPVFFGLFAALRASIDLRQAPWLWVQDLSQPDHLIRFASSIPNPMNFCAGCCGPGGAGDITGLHILPLLMTAAWVANSYFMPRPESSTPEQEQMRKMMMF